MRGHLVEAPIVRQPGQVSVCTDADVCTHQEFLIDDKEFVSGVEWMGLNPTLPIYI